MRDHGNRISFIYLLFGGLHAFGVFVLPGVIDDDSSVSFIQRNWGFHFLSYFAFPVIGIAYAAFGVSLIHRVQDRVAAAFIDIHTWISRIGKHTGYLLISTLALVVFWLLQQKYMILGDGHGRSAELDLGIVHATAASYVHVLMYVSSAFGLTGRDTIKIVSIIQGLPFVLLALLVSHEIGRTALTRVISAFIIICSGVVQFYAGYIEVYAPVPILTLLAVWFGLKGANRTAFRYCALAVSMAAALTHPLGTMLVPPAFYLIWYHDVRGRGPRVTVPFAAAMAIGAACGILLLGLGDKVQSAALPLLQDQQNVYAILTAVNVWERLNGFILACPAGVPLLCVLTTQARPRAVSSQERYLQILALLGLIALFVCDFILGSLDWDLMALVSFPVTLALSFRVSVLSEETVRRVVVPAVAISLISTASWICINHTDASITRLEDIVSNEPAAYFRTHSGPIRIALGLRAEGRNDLAIGVLERAAQQTPSDIEILSSLAGFRFEAGHYAETIKPARTFLESMPWNVYAYQMLLKSYIALDRDEDAQKLASEHSDKLIIIGASELEAGKLETAAYAFGGAAFMDLQNPATLLRVPGALDLLTQAYRNKSQQTKPVPFASLPEQFQKLARRSYELGSPEVAILYWRASIKMGRRDAAMYQNMGLVLEELGRKDEAEHSWREGVRHHPEDSELTTGLSRLLGAGQP